MRPVRGLFEPGQPKVAIENVVAEGPWVAVEALGRGRFRNGAEYENQYSFVLEVEGGRIRAIHECMDTHYAAESVARGMAEIPA